MRRFLLVLGSVGFAVGLAACTAPAVPQIVNSNANTNTSPSSNVNTANSNTNAPVATSNTNAASAAALVSPLDNPAGRITKKFFGTYITPKTSPVQPERFTGYHTAVDFETVASEAKIDVPVVAACIGKVRARQFVSGYGGVLVQDCTVSGQVVTALYGHLRLSSITIKVGTTLKTGTEFAVLGTGFSSETDGERKHLHFSLHKGSAINWKGYVSTKAALSDWLDPQKYW